MENFVWKDWTVYLVIGAFIAAMFIFFYTKHVTGNLSQKLRPVVRVANPDVEIELPKTKDEAEKFEDEVKVIQKRMNCYYTLYMNLTSTLPLFGMFGTVNSLLRLVGKMDGDAMPTDQFFSALWTTWFGIVFAVICKLIVSRLTTDVEDNNHEIDTLKDRNSKRFEQNRREELPQLVRTGKR